VPVSVVDILETISIDEQQGHVVALPLAAGNCHIVTILKQPSARQAGQLIVMCDPVNALDSVLENLDLRQKRCTIRNKLFEPRLRQCKFLTKGIESADSTSLSLRLTSAFNCGTIVRPDPIQCRFAIAPISHSGPKSRPYAASVSTAASRER
jgi:hypothetical protein